MAGTFVVMASYSGDAANLPSSTTDSVTVMVPDFELSSPGDVATVTAGQSATTTLNVIPFYGYHGTVTFSCGTLEIGETCIFNPTTVSPSNGMLVSSTVIPTTKARTTAHLRGLAEPLQNIAWASILCLIFTPRRTWRLSLHLLRTHPVHSTAGCRLLSLSSCSSSLTFTELWSKQCGTPADKQTIVVTGTDAASNLAHSINLILTVQWSRRGSMDLSPLRISLLFSLAYWVGVSVRYS
jgi:hypothetical protein